MNRHTAQAINIEELSQTGEARRMAASIGQQIGMDESAVGRLSIVVTELSRNIVLHARRGQLLFRSVVDGKRAGVEILALDHGPGIPDIERSLEDGYSTAGTPGTGFGAARRMSDYFDIYSQVGKGTGILSCVFSGARCLPAHTDSQILIGAVSVPIPGLQICGDGWAMQSEQATLIIDDDEISRYLTRGVLQGLGLECIEAANGIDGLQLAHQQQPFFIVLDLEMPELDGYETLQRLKADTVTRDIPVIIQTSKILEDADRRRLASMGARIVSKASDASGSAGDKLREVLERMGLASYAK